MIPLKIKTKTGKIKLSIPEYGKLSVKIYKDLISAFANGETDIVKYICITNNIDYVKALDFVIPEKDLQKINSSLGEFRTIKADQPPINNVNYIEDIKPNFYVKVDHGTGNNEYFDLSNSKIETAGHRLLIEQEIKNKATWLDLYTFSVAMLMVNVKRLSNQKKYDYFNISYKELTQITQILDI